MTLEALRRKVEAGDRLSEDEFGMLRKVAQSQGGLTWRLALAHALMNAEAAGQALSLLERLEREHPRDIRVLLGHARALVALDRWAEAERPLNSALAHNPNDCEAQKALAVLCLRRGEVARARRLVADVLRMDPFDSEAQLLQAEFEHAELPPPKDGGPDERHPAGREVALRSDFTSALARALSKRGFGVMRSEGPQGEGHLRVRLGPGKVARVDLESLYAGYLADGRALPEVVSAFAQELLGEPLELPQTNDALLARVLPVLRAPAFVDRARSAAAREGPAGLLVYFVIEDPKLVRYLPLAALEARRLTLEALDAAAWDNLGRRLTEPRPVTVTRGEVRLAPSPTGLWALCEEDGHDGARLLVPAQRERLLASVGPGPYRVGLGQRELVLVCREDKLPAVTWLESLRCAQDGISGRFRLDADGGLTDVGVAAGS